MKKQLLALGCALMMSACSVTPNMNGHRTSKQHSDTANKEFTEFLEQDFIDTLTQDYTTLHQYVSDPEAYGIKDKDVEVSFGHVTYTDEEIKEYEEYKKKLNSFDVSTLDETQQAIYDQSQFQNAITDELIQDKYKYLNNLWSSSGGPNAELTNYFESIFVIYREDDIKDLITLINDVPRYTKEIMDFTKEQAEHDCLSFDYETIQSSLDQTLASAANSTVYTSLAGQVDALNLDAEKAEKYKQEIREALDTSFYPSIQTMKSGLEELKDKVKPYSGLASKENGKEYYKYLLRTDTGTTKDPETIRNELVSALTQQLMALNGSGDPGADITTSFQSPQEVLEFMRSVYAEHFPKVDIPEYNIQDLPDEQCSPSVVAYYVPSPIDRDQVNQMRFNQRDYGQETTTVDFYTTFCHEGIPGHMYQHAYNREHFQYDIQNLMDSLAFSEGYANYVEERVLYDLDNVSEQQARTYSALNNANNYLVCIMDIDINYGGLSLQEFSDQYKDMFGEEKMESIYNQLCDIPGTFLAYYYGGMRIRQFRSMAEEELGDKFDEVAFHDALLKNGSVNFSIVEESILDYIDENE